MSRTPSVLLFPQPANTQHFLHKAKILLHIFDSKILHKVQIFETTLALIQFLPKLNPTSRKSCLNQVQASDQGNSKSRYLKPLNLVDFQGLRSENENGVNLEQTLTSHKSITLI